MKENNFEALRGVNGELVFQVKLGSKNLAEVLSMLGEGTQSIGKNTDAPADGTNTIGTTAGGAAATTDAKESDSDKAGCVEEYAKCGTGYNPNKEAQDGEAPSRMVQLQALRKMLDDIHNDLRNADSVHRVRNALDGLEGFLDDIEHDADLDTYVPNLRGILNGVNLHDKTRKELDDAIGTVLDAIDGIITKEEKREKAEMLKRLFLELADKAEELIDIIDVRAIVGW